MNTPIHRLPAQLGHPSSLGPGGRWVGIPIHASHTRLTDKVRREAPRSAVYGGTEPFRTVATAGGRIAGRVIEISSPCAPLRATTRQPSEQFDRATLSAAIGGTYFTPTAFGILRKEPRSPATSAQANLGFAADDLDNQRHTGSAMRRGSISNEEEA